MFYKYSPKDLYKGIDNLIPLPQVNPLLETSSEIEYPPCTFLITFANNLNKYGGMTAVEHAALLGVPVEDLRTTVKTLTGKCYTDFTNEYIALMAYDLIKGRKGYIGKLYERLGFKSYSGLFRYTVRYLKLTPNELKYTK